MTISSLIKSYLERQLAQICENCENIKYHEPAKDKEEDRSAVLYSPSFLSPASKPGPGPKLGGVD